MNTVINITNIPFSRYGAYLAVTRDVDQKTGVPLNNLTVYTSRRRFEESPLFSLAFSHDETADFSCTADPSVVTVTAENGYAKLYIREDDTLVVVSKGLNIQLRQKAWGYGTQDGDRTYRMITGVLGLYSTITVQKGTVHSDGPYNSMGDGKLCDQKTILNISCENNEILMAVKVSPKELHYASLPICPEVEIEAVQREWSDFLAQLPQDTSTDAKTANFVRVTWYNLWSSYVRAEDNYPNDTMLMTKKYMSSTWSWDHCFNALSMAHLQDIDSAKQSALNQFNAPFVLQTPKGVLPDMWNPGLETRWGTTKPPIHGWCFSKLMDLFEFNKSELEMVYDQLVRWTDWWMTYSDTDGDGIPDYPQGCDSGWDNSTLFDIGYFLESPDLPAFLILQMKTLSRIAEKLNMTSEMVHWDTEADELMKRFLEHSWTGERFVAKVSHTHEYEEAPTSLLSLMPLALGEYLPTDIFNKLADILERDFLTENGPATEMPTSPKYIPDGYWRGPIWAPTTYLLVDGLRRGGNAALAEEIAKRYCNMSCNRAEGNYENFDALTGLGLRAPGYTWAASVYMLLHWEYGY